MNLRELAPAKVNLCLFLGGLRPDGRHELVTVLESISLADELELTTLESGAQDVVVCPGVEGVNLVSQALEQLRARGWSAPPVRIKIEKRIPVAAGLGGGSADAAATLRLAQRLAPVPGDALLEIAGALGADVPSQLEPGLTLGTGAGEEISRYPPFGEHAFVILPQPAMLSTADVYREADRLGLGRPAAELESLRGRLRESLANTPLVNDLAPAALSLCPGIAAALEAATGAGADHALVCGSGPTVAALYWGESGVERAAEASAGLAQRFPGAVAAQPVSS
jgi:4-diphosphocytidyl-2-C-methyl-D-erythritol kinase